MRRFFVALILLSVPVSTSALAHSGTEQDEKACAPDVKRFCRKLVDQGDFTVLACLKENRPKLSTACPGASQPRAMTAPSGHSRKCSGLFGAPKPTSAGGSTGC